MKKLRTALTAAGIVGALASITLVAAPANASATSTSGPVSVNVTGSGLTVNSSYTRYVGTATGPTVTGRQWTANGQINHYGNFNIGPVCALSKTYTFSLIAWKAKGNTTLYGQWIHTGGGSWDSHKPSVGIHS